jgi:integrase
MASFQQRGNRVRAVIRIKGQPTEIKPFRSLEDAQAWATKREEELRGVALGSPVGTSGSLREALNGSMGTNALPSSTAYPMTLGEALERYRDEVSPTKKGAKREQEQIRLWLRTPLASRPLAAITTTDLVEWRRAEEATPVPGGKSRSPDTVRRRLVLLSAVYGYARSEWAMPDLMNPVQGVKKPKARRGREVSLSPEEREVLWETLRSPRRSIYIYYIVRLASLTAMRQGELLIVTWDQWRGRVIRLEDTKNGERRNVPLSSEALKILREWHGTCGSPSKGRIFPVSSNAIIQAFIKVIKAVRKANSSFPHVTFHDLRHIAATDLSKKLSNVLELSAVTGHRSIQVLKRYYNPDAEDLAAKLG